ncbi:nuclease-like protein [Motilibacter rhizosphaerae]|uniref:Nuclease-like protein n=1 Tax=Motilibacter rhizosphaerae TaxID=598652 RepID=A0A4Q7NNS7_9ACTN|nr:nuclease-related domain-containing protein [Motilibacter rhizosphaerae]RZS86891.1 nuclease-like protein [Motilibacter rhizosphaerae]
MEQTLTLVRWRRYGKDRLYVRDGQDQQLGWHDLLTGHTMLNPGARALEVERAVAHWRSQHGFPSLGDQQQVPQPVQPRPAPARSTPPSPPGEDLAQRRAGAAAREQADAERRAAPVRTLVARVLGVHTDERAWRIGAKGEEKVAAELQKLIASDPRWCVLHAVPVGNRGSDIDHVVVGPGGVFTLNAKHHPDATIWVGGDSLRVNGRPYPYVRNSRHEAARAARLLSAACGMPVPVQGLVVPVGAAKLTIRDQPRDVTVVPRSQVARWLRALPERLSPQAAQLVYEKARDSRTWTSRSG